MQHGPAAHDRTEGPANAHGTHRHARLEWRSAHHPLDQGWDVRRQAEHHHARQRANRQACRDDRQAHQLPGDQRLGSPSLRTREERQKGHGTDGGTDHQRRSPADLDSQRGCQQEQRDPKRERQAADPVEPMLAPLHLLVQNGGDQHGGNEADRNVEIEDPAPSHGGGDEAT